MSIETELLSALGSGFSRKGKTESEVEYTKRIVKNIAAIDESKWDTLSNEAQAWFNEAAEMMNTSKPPPKLLTDTEKEEKAEEPSKAKVALKSQSPKSAAKDTAKTKPTIKVKSDESASTVARKLFCTDPSLSVDDVLNSLSKAGKNASKTTVATIGFEVRKTIETLKDLGLMK